MAVTVIGLALAACGGTPAPGPVQTFIQEHTACPAASYISPQWSPDGALIYFDQSTVSTPTADLHVMTSLGRDDRLLAHDVLGPLLSPDGTQVLFQRASAQGFQSYHFFVLDVRSAQAHALSTAGVRASWSPDSQWFAYAAPVQNSSPIVKANVQTNQITQLTPGGIYSDTPQWSPDGRMIAFTTSEPAGPTRILLMGADGSALTALGGLDGLVCPSSTGVDEGTQIAAWRPDGRALAVQRVCQDKTTLSIVTPAGSEVSRMDLPGGAHGVRWSPDGKRLVFTARALNATTDAVFLAAVDPGDPASPGPGVRELQADASSPRWSPDGTRIVFVGQDSAGLSQIYTVGADGSGMQQITDNPGGSKMCLH